MKNFRKFANFAEFLQTFGKHWQHFDKKIEIAELCKEVRCVDLGESFPKNLTNIWLQKSASIQPGTSPPKFGLLRRFKCKTNNFQPLVRTNLTLLHEVTTVEILMHLCVGAIEIGTLLKNQVDIAAVSTRMCFLKPLISRHLQRCQTEIHYLIYIDLRLFADCFENSFRWNCKEPQILAGHCLLSSNHAENSARKM